jgi:hypothetical protein
VALELKRHSILTLLLFVPLLLMVLHFDTNTMLFGCLFTFSRPSFLVLSLWSTVLVVEEDAAGVTGM